MNKEVKITQLDTGYLVRIYDAQDNRAAQRKIAIANLNELLIFLDKEFTPV